MSRHADSSTVLGEAAGRNQLRRAPVSAPFRTLSARTLGALAVVGVVVAFSLSSTLVKRADSPGVLVAFWRMATVTVVWNSTSGAPAGGSRLRDVRQALVPGVFFGLNLAVFFAGATHNSVANAALIGSLAPFLIVPIGAKLFHEHIHPRALAFALVAFGGVVLVLFSAPANGDASARATCSASSRCCCGRPTWSRRGTSAATWTSRPSWRRSARSRRSPCCRWRSPTGTCSA